MATAVKLTISLDSALIAKAKRVAKNRRTSVSSMVSNYISSLNEDRLEPHTEKLPPVTQHILEMGKKLPKVSANWDYRDELGDILMKRYDVK